MHRGEWQHLLDQPSRLSQHLLVAARRRAQDEFGDPGIDIGGDPRDDRAGIADGEITPRVAAGPLAVSLEQAGETGIIGPAEAERDASAVMVVINRPAFGDRRGPDRSDDGADIVGGLAASLPAGAEAGSAPDR